MTMTMVPARELRQRLTAGLEEARARTLLLLAPLSDEELHTQHDPLMSPIIWDLGHIAHFEELWLTRNLDGPDRVRRDARDVQPVRASPEHARRPAAARARSRPRGDGRDPRPRARPPRRRPTSTAISRCCATATSTRWCCSTSTSTTRPSSRRCSSSRAQPYSPPARARAAGRAAAGLRSRGHGAISRRPGRDRHRRPLRRLRQRAAAALGRAAAVLDRRASGHQRRVPGLHRRPAATPVPSSGRTRGGAGCRSPRREAPKYWLRSADGWMTRLMDRVGPVRAGPSGLPRLLPRGRGVRPLGRQAAAHRDGMGGGRVLGPGDRPQAPLPLGR